MCPRLAKSSSKASNKQVATALQREQMIAVAAYFRAEQRGFFGGDPDADWLEAETEIDRILHSSTEPESRPDPKQFFQEKLEAQLKDWDRNLEDFKLRAHDLKTKSRIEYEKQLEIFSRKRTELHDRLHELRKSSEGAWEDLKEGTERSLAEMREAVDRIASRFK